MTEFKSEFLRTISARGFIHQCSDAEALDAYAAKETMTAYIGFDCTGPSLHVGHLMGIMMLRRLQQAGHKPIVLMGGGTTKVGDPSGKDEARQMLTDEIIAANMASIKTAFDSFLTFGDGPTDAIMVNNAEWLDKIEYIPFLRDYGRHFSVNRMLSFDSVKMRLEREQPLSFLEFNYMILQAYDFVELNKRYGCKLQMGGSDQWGNIINGIELGRRAASMELYGTTCPLITTSSGAKMGKTASGAVWLNADMRSPFEYWQFWRNTEDGDVGRFLRLFTELPLDEISRLEALEGAELNDAKKVLATEATAMLHGRAEADRAAGAAKAAFEEGALSADLPTVEIDGALLDAGLGVLNAFVAAGLCASTSDVRRQIKGGALRVNDALVSDDKMVLTRTDVVGGVVKLSMGKKRHVLLKG